MNENVLDAPERMQCMEIWGGNSSIRKDFRAPGIDIYVYSKPFGESAEAEQQAISSRTPTEVGQSTDERHREGGDIYYLTSCASGRITRFLLADVSGHGQAASQLAVTLRDLLRENVNRISQEKFVRKMNREFGQIADVSGFATAIVATFFEPLKKLSISVAGHPHPLFYRSEERKWFSVSVEENSTGTADVDNLPLGIHGDSSYPRSDLFVEKDDMFLLYSDAFIESLTQDRRLLGIDGMLDILNRSPNSHPSEVIPVLREKIKALHPKNLQADDATVILGHFTSTRVRFIDNFIAPFRLFRDVSDATSLASSI